MFSTIFGAMLLFTAGGAVIDIVNSEDPKQASIQENYEEEDDKPYKEFWCDCHYWVRCDNGESLDHYVGYRGMGKKEARRNACMQASSSARYHCLQRESKVDIFAVREVLCEK